MNVMIEDLDRFREGIVKMFVGKALASLPSLDCYSEEIKEAALNDLKRIMEKENLETEIQPGESYENSWISWAEICVENHVNRVYRKYQTRDLGFQINKCLNSSPAQLVQRHFQDEMREIGFTLGDLGAYRAREIQIALVELADEYGDLSHLLKTREREKEVSAESGMSFENE